MKRLDLALIFLAGVVTPAFADTYQVTFGWDDTTVYRPGETPSYTVKHRVNGGAETVLPPQASRGASFSVTATPGQTIEAANKACNGALCSAYSAWVTATAQHPPTTPNVPSNHTLTVVRTGP